MISGGWLRRTAAQLDKSMFAKQRRVIQPIVGNPSVPNQFIKAAHTTDPLKESRNLKFASGGDVKRETLDIPQPLEGAQSRKQIESQGDREFNALIDFVSGAQFDNMITGRRFKKAYEALTENDDIFVWLCMTSMAVLNPGDVRSRHIYRHLEALVQAVTSNEMTMRTAFRFYESAIRSPAYREIAARQTENGAATRLAGICAAADAMRKLGICRRPMTAYFELYQRIVERSEAMTPWGFPPLFQFEERLSLEPRLKFFTREERRQQRRKVRRGALLSKQTRLFGPKILWIPPTWRTSKNYLGAHYVHNPGLISD